MALSVLNRPARQREFAADEVAANRFGEPFTADTAAWLKANGARDPGTGWDLLSTHPSYRRRIRAAGNHR
jgi:Zn-dependent protease with chaperone function